MTQTAVPNALQVSRAEATDPRDPRDPMRRLEQFFDADSCEPITPPMELPTLMRPEAG